ncbi:MAG: MJ1255/VC2487 family glycosyltransferase [Patescibacteria group bacterium]|jgi:uncharacterized protein (TIGR00661 family)
MARILYSVQGVGMGHAMRSLVVIEHLCSEGHEVIITANHKAYDFFKTRYPRVYELKGFDFVLDKNGMMLWIPTFLRWVEKMPVYFLQNTRRLRKIINEFKPQIVVTDFEPFAHYIANIYRLPLVSIDNQQRIIFCPLKLSKGYRDEIFRAKAAIKSFIVKADYYIILDFAGCKLKKEKNNVFLTPPILRKEIVRAQPTDGNKILVYMWERYADRAIQVLNKIPEHNFILYGLNREGKEGNVELRLFSTENMVKDLAACHAIIGNAGFTLVSEAMFLQKPFLVVPMAGQFEQIVNALEIKEKNYGLTVDELTVENVREFLSRLPEFKKSLQGKDFCGNEKVFTILDKIIKDNSR